ncbi:MAG: ATP-binding cassette subfamily C protein LapB, partial [Rickettsiales bacterium]
MPKVSIKGESLDSCAMSIIKEENPQLYKYAISQLKRYSSDDPDSLMKILGIIGLQTRIKSVEIDKASSEKHQIIALLKDGNYCMVKSADKETVEISSSKEGEATLKVKTNKFNQDFYAGKVLVLHNLKGEDGERKAERTKSYFWFWDAIRSYRGFYTNVILAALMINIFSLIIPLFAMNVYDRVIPNYSSDTLWALASGVFLIIIFDFVLKMLRSYFVENTSKKIDLKLSNSIFSKTLHLYMNNHSDPVGVRANKIKEFDSIRDFLSSITLVGIIDFPFLIITIAIIYYIGGQLAIIPASALILAILLTLILNKPLNKYTERYVKGSAKKNSLLFESLFNIEAIKNLCAQPLIMRKWEEDCKLTSKAISKLRFFASFIVNATSSLGFISSVLTIIIGTHLIWSSNLTIGGLIACSILSGRCLAPIAQITTIITRFEQVKCSLKNLDDIMTLR